MSNTRVLLGFYLAIAGSFSLGSNVALSQAAVVRPQLQGYSGTLNVISNARTNDVTVALNMAYDSGIASNQIVFHLQLKAGSQLPEGWHGSGRVLVGNGVLAILPKGQSTGMLFRFSNLPVPISIRQMSFTEYSVFGIARYGEHTALSPAEIQQLATTGHVTGD